MKTPLRVRTQLLVLCAVFVSMMLGVGAVGGFSTRQQSNAMLGLYNDRIVPLVQLKTVADLYAVAQAKDGIDTEWTTYIATELVPEEKRLIARMGPLRQTADAALDPLQT
jgi:methyl-accepting chemotaxis protein